MNGQDLGSPVSAILSDSNRSPSAWAVSEATLLTIGISALAPLLECLMSHMGSSGEAKRQALTQSNQNASLDLSNLTQAIALMQGASNSSRSSGESSRSRDTGKSDLAVT